MCNNHGTSYCQVAAGAAGRSKLIRLGHKSGEGNQSRLESEKKALVNRLEGAR